jgi:hypothetical protein
MKESAGVSLPQTSTTTTFIEHICATSTSGGKIKCSFEN